MRFTARWEKNEYVDEKSSRKLSCMLSLHNAFIACTYDSGFEVTIFMFPALWSYFGEERWISKAQGYHEWHAKHSKKSGSRRYLFFIQSRQVKDFGVYERTKFVFLRKKTVWRTIRSKLILILRMTHLICVIWLIVLLIA